SAPTPPKPTSPTPASPGAHCPATAPGAHRRRVGVTAAASPAHWCRCPRALVGEAGAQRGALGLGCGPELVLELAHLAPQVVIRGGQDPDREQPGVACPAD